MASREQRRRSRHLASEKVKFYEKKKKSNPVMWFISILILVVIVVTFIGAPLTSKTSSGNDIVFGSYDGEEIIYYQGSYFYDQVNTIADEYRDSITDENAFFIQYQVWHTAFNKSLVRTAAISECKQGGFKVSDNAVDETIILYGPYMENGEFSENIYKQSSNTEKNIVRKRFRENLFYSKFLTDLTSNNINKSEEEFFKNLAKPEKKFSYVLFPFSDYPEDKIKDYGEKNSKLFRTIKLSSITIDSGRNEADQILTKLNEDPDMFSETAKTQSSDPYAQKGGEIGERYYYDMSTLITDEDFLNSLFSLKAGEISGIFENDETWVIYKCESPAENMDFNKPASIKTVKEYMESFAKGTIEDYLTEQADNFRKNAIASSFTEAASSNNIKIYETNSFPIIYGNPSLSYYEQPIPIYTQPSSTDPDKSLDSLNNNEYALKQLAKLKLNDVSEAIVLPNSIAILQLKEEIKEISKDVENITNYIDYASKNWISDEFESIVLKSDKVKDNFSNVFSNIFKQ